jgi:photosystem II stability/assembly factor-like uncharacterized protein
MHTRCTLSLLKLFLLISSVSVVGCPETKVIKNQARSVASGGKARAPASVAAVKGRWRPVGFSGAANVLSVRFDPKQRGVVYAASDTAGVFRSTDAGERWTMHSNGLGNYEIPSLAVDPFDSKILYAAVGAFPKAKKAGLYISRDAGRSWKHLRATFSKGITFRKYRNVASIAPDPATKGTLLVGSAHNGLWRSTDHGEQWERVLEAPLTRAKLDMPDEQAETPMPYRAPISMVAFQPGKPKTVFAALYGGGVYRSAASGKAGSWKPANKGLPKHAAAKFLAFGQGVVYLAAARHGLFKSRDGGASWTRATGDLPLKHGWVSAVAVPPKRPRTALVVLANEEVASVWRTTDDGDSWEAQGSVTYDDKNNPTRTWARSATKGWWIAVDPHDPRRFFFTDYWGIQRSDDGGETWADKVIGVQNTVVTSLVLDRGGEPGRPDTLFATYMDAGLHASVDGGRIWRPLMPRSYSEALSGHYWKLVQVTVKGKRKRLYMTMDPWSQQLGKVLRSDDGGESWRMVFKHKRPKGFWMSGYMLGLAAAPSDPATLYVTQDGGKVHVTKDGGKRWRPTAGQPADRSFTHALAVDKKGRVFAGTLNGGLYRSTNGGKRWARVLEDLGTIWKVVAAGDAVYASAGDDANLYRSVDGGASWKRLTSFKRPDHGDETGNQGMAIAVDPANPKHLLFSRVDTSHSADQSAGVVESMDGGGTWREANDNLGMTSVNVLIFGRGKAVYGGTWGAGIWRRD